MKWVTRLVVALALVTLAGAAYALPAEAANNVYGTWATAPTLVPQNGTIYTSGGIQITGSVNACPMVQFQDAIYADGHLVAVEPAQQQCYQPLNNVAFYSPAYACPASGVHAYQHILGYWVNWYGTGWGGFHQIAASPGTVGACR